MSSFIYNRFKRDIANGTIDWDAAVVRCLLERSTSTYVPNKDQDFLSSFTGGGGVEISVATYARQSLAGKVVNEDDTNDRAELDCNDLAFGNLESGQTVKALLVYVQIGGDDTTPADDILVCYLDGKIDVTLAAPAASAATTIYVDPLIAAIPSGTAVDFGGGATATLSSGAAVGARSLSISALGAAAAAGAVSSTGTGSVLPAALGNGPFTVTIDAEGLIQLR